MRTTSIFTISILILLITCLPVVQCIWFPWYLHRYGLRPHSERHGGATPPHVVKGGKAVGSTETRKGAAETSTGPGTVTACPAGYKLKSPHAPNNATTQRLCDDNPVLLQLARLYAVSPERIMLLLAQPTLDDSCVEINDVLTHIEHSTRDCYLAENNIYGKLANALGYFKTEVCDGGDSNTRKRCVELSDSHRCIRELHIDMIECEAPADWYERRNATKVCRIYNDILDCYYTRAAMLCGLETARHLRSLAGDCMGRALIHSCQVSKLLPNVDSPMPSSQASIQEAGHVIIYQMPEHV